MQFRHTDALAALAAGLPPAEFSRRQFLKLTTLAGSGLTLGILLPGCAPGKGTGGAATAAAAVDAVRAHRPGQHRHGDLQARRGGSGRLDRFARRGR